MSNNRVMETTKATNDLPAAVSNDIEKWKRWKAKKNSPVTLSRHNENTLYFQVGTKYFTITYPNDYPNDGSILMIESSDSLSWINKVMNFTIRKNPSIFTLLKFIEKEQEEETRVVDDIDVSNFNDDELLLTKFDIEEAKYERRLKEKLSSMKSGVVADSNTKASELFNGNIPGHILINMLLTTRKKYNNDNKISVQLKDDNVYNWIVEFKRFRNDAINDALGKVKTDHGYDSIQISIMFHDKLFPSYPPFIKILRPRMMGSLMHRISNLKMVQFDYWTPSRTIEYIIDKLYDILEKHTEIDIHSEMNNVEKFPNGSYHELEGVLVKLASLCDVGTQFEELDATEYKRVHDTSVKSKAKKIGTTPSSSSSKTSSKQQCWAPGTGYGYSGSSKWDINEYVQLQQERDVQIQSILQKVTEILMTMQPQEAQGIYKILESSYLIPYVKTLFKDTTMVEVDKHMNLYKPVFTLLQYLITEDSMFLFDDNHGDRNLFQILADINNEALTVKLISEAGDSDKSEAETDYDITSMITSLFDFASSCYGPYYENKLKHQEEMEVKKIHEDEQKRTAEEKVKDAYVEEMTKHKFAVAKFIDKGFHYKFSSSNDKTMMRTIGKECSSFTKSLPIHFGSSVLARVDSTNSRCMRVMITGPNDTPYDSGVFIFDAYMPDTWPNINPQMHFENHGSIRFNPNLYADGKVCLSLLGTWRGDASESWNPKTSTLTQLFVSVQSQILIDNPHYNEPGYEKSYGTNEGIESCRKYNNYIRYYNMQHAMLGVIDSVQKGKYAELKEPILAHFKLKKDYILTVCQKWVNEAIPTTSSPQHSGTMNQEMYKSMFAKVQEVLNKL